MSEETPGELVPTSSWSCSTGHQRGVDHVFPIQLASVVEALLVQELPQKLDRRLGSVEFQSRHIDIVNKDGDGLVRSRSKKSFSFFV